MPEATEAGVVTPIEAIEAAAVEEFDQVEAENPVVEEEKPAKTYSQEEVDKIVKKAKSNTRHLTRKETEADLYRRMADQRQEPAIQPTPAADAAPRREDFDDYETYIDARTEFKTRQTIRAERSDQTQQQLQTDRVSKHQQNQIKARAELPDFDDVVDSAEIPVSAAMVEAILDSELSAKLQYHLAKNPQEVERISRLSPASQIKAIGKIEDTLATPETSQMSKAPAPITPIGSGSAAPKALEKLGMDEFKARAKARGAFWAR